MQFVVSMEGTVGEDGGVSVLIELVMVVTDKILLQRRIFKLKILQRKTK